MERQFSENTLTPSLLFARLQEIRELLFRPGPDCVRQELADRFAVGRIDVEGREQVGLVESGDKHAERQVLFVDDFAHRLEAFRSLECDAVNDALHPLERIGPFARFERSLPASAGFVRFATAFGDNASGEQRVVIVRIDRQRLVEPFCGHIQFPLSECDEGEIRAGCRPRSPGSSFPSRS